MPRGIPNRPRIGGCPALCASGMTKGQRCNRPITSDAGTCLLHDPAHMRRPTPKRVAQRELLKGRKLAQRMSTAGQRLVLFRKNECRGCRGKLYTADDFLCTACSRQAVQAMDVTVTMLGPGLFALVSGMRTPVFCGLAIALEQDTGDTTFVVSVTSACAARFLSSRLAVPPPTPVIARRGRTTQSLTA